jgi:predicted glycosyltransferase involved in capsule biosynthesis
MSKSISINMKFWDDGHPDATRIRNVIFTYKKLKKMSSFLSENGINVNVTLYDFSPEQIIPDSKHIPYPLGVYKKSEKTNLILKEKSDYDFFMMMDCDAFFNETDYDKMLNIINGLEKNDVITFDLAKLDDNVSDYITNGEFIVSNANWSYAYSGNKENGPLNGYSGGLGGVYICDTELLQSLGGFNEEYVGWGGEDGDMLDRIYTSGKQYSIKPTKEFAPFHLPHFSDWGNINYNKRFNDE